ncbi:uncharacterized protein LOC114518681 [Dendronephthya gigantea]|uniref:uncharacterized protein LOC114518681 n=1 Tax=Dendronephthya gigantea TaxID=151771 RepID=UPI00106CB908|nr:uncharacterized protein LOC114518681 [Dendronephthya gigantea]
MPPFRWPKVEHDLALCKEVVAERPVRPEDWEIIASSLSVIFSTTESQVHLKGRSCREHLDLLVKKFKADEKNALKRSGTEEDYTELTQLLEDITSYLNDMSKPSRNKENKDEELNSNSSDEERDEDIFKG